MNPLLQQYGIQPQAPQMPAAPSQGSNLMSFLSQAKQMMQGIKNPQQFVLQNLTGIPAEIQNDPNAILNYALQHNMFNEDQKALLNLYQNGGLRF